MDRRLFLTASLGVAALGCALPRLACCRLASDARTLTLIDRSLSGNATRALVRARIDGPVIAVGEDVGALWHAHVRHWDGRVTGMLRPSDCFVLRTFSIADERAFRTVRVGSNSIAFAIEASRPVIRVG